jgi:hypothetical protein
MSADNVVVFGHHSGRPVIGGETDPTLSKDLGEVYGALSLDHKSNAVVLNPSTPDYEPFIVPDGSLRVGEFGITDFNARFEHTDINPASFYITFMALRHSLQEIMVGDDGLHAEVQNIARSAMRTMPRFSKAKDVHRVEAELIGQTAADIAIRRQTMHIQPNKRLHERVKVQLAASEIKVPIVDNKEVRSQRKKSLGQIAMEVPAEILNNMNSAIVTTIKQRQTEAAS